MEVSLSHPTPMYCDNQSSIQIAHNSIFHDRAKHIEIDCHLTRLCIVTTRVLFKLLTTRFFITQLSILKSIVILLVIISTMTPLLYLFFLFLCRLYISLPIRIPFLAFIF
jgi:hypothetical protein